MLYMVTFTINIPPMLAYIPYMDPMGFAENELVNCVFSTNVHITGPQKRQPF